MLLIKNAHIRPMAGEDIANGEILIDGGKIAGIGVKVDAPEDAEIIDAEGRLVTPGIVEAHCHTGDSALKKYAEEELYSISQPGAA